MRLTTNMARSRIISRPQPGSRSGLIGDCASSTVSKNVHSGPQDILSCGDSVTLKCKYDTSDKKLTKYRSKIPVRTGVGLPKPVLSLTFKKPFAEASIELDEKLQLVNKQLSETKVTINNLEKQISNLLVQLDKCIREINTVNTHHQAIEVERCKKEIPIHVSKNVRSRAQCAGRGFEIFF